MAMNPDTGQIRPLNSREDLKAGEVLFQQGELIDIRGCIFQVEQIYPNPDNKLILRGDMKGYTIIDRHPLNDAVGISGDWYLCAMTCSICCMPYTVKVKGNSNTGSVPKCPYCGGWKSEL